MILDKSDIGRRIISQYHYLNGEDWRNRWEKMQNQDNLAYVLGNLYGDDVDINILTTYYNSFKQIYENIKSSILRSFDSKSKIELDLGILITQIKIIAEEIVQRLNSVNWDYRILDSIIRLIAHLFALWTLKNT
jgi:hypothetical protein